MEKNSTSIEDLKKFEEKYDPQLSFRKLGPKLSIIVTTILVSMSLYHFWASGFGLVREVLHRGIHIAYVIGLVFIVFSWKKNTENETNKTLFSFQNVSVLDYIFAILTVTSALYLPLLPSEILAARVGNPELIDVAMGSVLILLTLEAARRSVGPTLPIISIIFILFAIFGPYAPGALKHGGTSWLGFVNHIYITNQGVYGIAVGVMAQYVFLFILFGVLATRVGLGKLFIDLAMLLAGRYSGGPAKVAIFSSAFMGTISGSSIANTVTTGSLTIPAMKKIGYPSHFSGAVEAASSTGGQITPPILGAAAFIMVEYLGLPLKDILAAALLPALFHYFGIFIMVHLEAKKLGLRGLNQKELPKFFEIMKDNWLSLLPLIVLVYFILAGRTPDFAAIYGIIACVVVGILKPKNKLNFIDLWNCLASGAKNTLAVGAAATCVGIIVGVVTLTGVGFRLGFVVLQTAGDIGNFFSNIWPISYFSFDQLKLFFSLVLIAISCIVMGAGIPTTATYIILVAVAAPALAQLNIEPLVAHFFVFYYGVLADITPPVALAAYAASGIAKSNPFKTGNTAFRLGIAKALVPFVFVYSPSLLLITNDFDLIKLTVTVLGTLMGIGLIGIAFTGYWIKPLKTFEQWFLGLAALLFVAPGLNSMIVGLIAISPTIYFQFFKKV
ncbi:TRAP transporter permease [Candidatus Pelagibacter sp. HIMB1321]|uniref:TRAP transporter permease n=1 Tax=Candidatus Pelagibacter sp. HIMB1321 TaxID=1388755 RepID=UPI000A080DBD|nr:TRAP transporter permease [Candidatus Pelagibacter sp. HIMB1321]SMF80143.1 TRAP transporter, 4TM/12TM fusion protein [Candidatus Pelagibacter sp. HIMB1321]